MPKSQARVTRGGTRPPAAGTAPARSAPRASKTEERGDALALEGVVTDVRPNGFFQVKLDQTGTEVLAHLSGKLRQRYVRVVLGDRVRVEVSTYDLTKGRITWRL